MDEDADAGDDLPDDGFLRQRVAAFGKADAAFEGAVYFEQAGGVVVPDDVGSIGGGAVLVEQGGGDQPGLAQSPADVGQ